MTIYCELKPDNKRFKQLISQYGRIWKIKERLNYVPALDGPGVKIEVLHSDYQRWVNNDQIAACSEEAVASQENTQGENQ